MYLIFFWRITRKILIKTKNVIDEKRLIIVLYMNPFTKLSKSIIMLTDQTQWNGKFSRDKAYNIGLA